MQSHFLTAVKPQKSLTSTAVASLCLLAAAGACAQEQGSVRLYGIVDLGVRRASGLTEFTRREAQKAQEGRFRSVDRLEKAMERLEAGEVVRSTKRRRPGAPPSVVYRVNPRLST